MDVESIKKNTSVPSESSIFVKNFPITIAITTQYNKENTGNDKILLRATIPWKSPFKTQLGVQILRNGQKIFESFEFCSNVADIALSEILFIDKNPPLKRAIYELQAYCTSDRSIVEIKRGITFISSRI